jgi:PKD repeat protein
VIDTAPSHGISSIFVGAHPKGVAITPDGTQAWVFATGFPNNQIAVIDVASQSVINYVPGSIGSFIAFSPDGKQAWTIYPIVGTATEYNRFSEAFVQTLHFPEPTQDLAITPDQAPTARFTVTTNGIVASFDASASSSPHGTIASYTWNFGDGSPEQKVTVPQISYSYAKVGTYTVTLTVTNTQGTSTFQTFTGQTVSNNGGPSALASQQITLDFAPPKFIGKSKIYKHHKKIFIKTKWSASNSSTVVRYKIAGWHRTRATIPATHKRKYMLRLHPQHKPHKYLSRKYIQYLERKYSIRALTATGVASTSTPIHIVHDRP